MVREGRRTGELQVRLVTSKGEFRHDEFAAAVSADSVLWTQAEGVAETTREGEDRTLKGRAKLAEELQLGGERLRFAISPDAFFQTNTEMAERLYAAAAEAAGLTGRERVFDLYCGIGTISPRARAGRRRGGRRRVVERAVADAIENARANGMDNARFYAGDVRTAMRPLVEEEGGADVVVVDPPRAGLSQKVVRRVLEVEAKTIVYVSCNPTTLAPNARQMVDAGYELAACDRWTCSRRPPTSSASRCSRGADRARRARGPGARRGGTAAPAGGDGGAGRVPGPRTWSPATGSWTRAASPASRRWPAGSTWFRNAYAVHDSTQYSVPAILTGRRPAPGHRPQLPSHPHSVFTLMDRLGYRVHAREEATTICPPRLCPRTDHYGNPHYNPLHRRRERLEHAIAVAAPHPAAGVHLPPLGAAPRALGLPALGAQPPGLRARHAARLRLARPASAIPS